MSPGAPRRGESSCNGFAIGLVWKCTGARCMPADDVIYSKLEPFNPLATRNEWLAWQLRFHREYALDVIPPRAMVGHLDKMTWEMEEAFFVGLADEVRPILEGAIAWIESQPEAALSAFSGPKEQWPSRWREALGLYKWLSRGDPANREFGAALESNWLVRARVNSGLVPDQERREREMYLADRLALALAAGQPLLGLQFFEASGGPPSPDEEAVLQFGWWACRHLVDGGSRDTTFVARGEELLRATLVPSYRWNGELAKPALWLKAIYFDSGVVETPEQAIAKAYDSMSWLERPAFVPG